MDDSPAASRVRIESSDYGDLLLHVDSKPHPIDARGLLGSLQRIFEPPTGFHLRAQAGSLLDPIYVVQRTPTTAMPWWRTDVFSLTFLASRTYKHFVYSFGTYEKYDYSSGISLLDAPIFPSSLDRESKGLVSFGETNVRGARRLSRFYEGRRVDILTPDVSSVWSYERDSTPIVSEELLIGDSPMCSFTIRSLVQEHLDASTLESLLAPVLARY